MKDKISQDVLDLFEKVISTKFKEELEQQARLNGKRYSEYQQEYQQRPGVKERLKEYTNKYYHKKVKKIK